MLLKSTLSSLPTYFLSLFTIPKAVTTRLKVFRGTFFGVFLGEFRIFFGGLGKCVYPLRWVVWG